jgi:hypothetical protein
MEPGLQPRSCEERQERSCVKVPPALMTAPSDSGQLGRRVAGYLWAMGYGLWGGEAGAFRLLASWTSVLLI